MKILKEVFLIFNNMQNVLSSGAIILTHFLNANET